MSTRTPVDSLTLHGAIDANTIEARDRAGALYKVHQGMVDNNSINFCMEVGTNEQWTKVKELCRVLELDLTDVHRHLRRIPTVNRRKLKLIFNRTPNTNEKRGADAWYLNWAGMIQFIVDSRKPKAEPMRRWLFDKVFPAIAKGEGIPPDARRGRGRPPGSKNKVKALPAPTDLQFERFDRKLTSLNDQIGLVINVLEKLDRRLDFLENELGIPNKPPIHLV